MIMWPVPTQQRMSRTLTASRISLVVLLLCQESLVLLCRAVPTGRRCPPVKGREAETCVCQTDMGVIDLTPIASMDGTPRFSGLRDGFDYIYSYNPCTTYSTTLCTDVYACQTSDADPGETTSIADGGTEEMWIDTDGTPYLLYTGPPNNARETKVFLECDVSAVEPIATTVGDTPPRELLHYEFNVTAADACPKAEGSKSVAGVIGFVLMLLFLAGFVVYFMVGALIMKFYYKRRGSEVIPNKSFWLQFPLLVQDGFLFTFGPCLNFIREKQRSAQGYQKA